MLSIIQNCIIDRCKMYIEYDIKIMWLMAEYILLFPDSILLKNGIKNRIANAKTLNENTQLYRPFIGFKSRAPSVLESNLVALHN